jgi:hypothetical protein
MSCWIKHLEADELIDEHNIARNDLSELTNAIQAWKQSMISCFGADRPAVLSGIWQLLNFPQF